MFPVLHLTTRLAYSKTFALFFLQRHGTNVKLSMTSLTAKPLTGYVIIFIGGPSKVMSGLHENFAPMLEDLAKGSHLMSMTLYSAWCYLLWGSGCPPSGGGWGCGAVGPGAPCALWFTGLSRLMGPTSPIGPMAHGFHVVAHDVIHGHDAICSGWVWQVVGP